MRSKAVLSRRFEAFHGMALPCDGNVAARCLSTSNEDRKDGRKDNQSAERGRAVQIEVKP